MTDKEQTSAPYVDDRGGDPIIALFVKVFASQKIGLPITVLSGGLTVSGYVISVEQFFAKTKELFSSASIDGEKSTVDAVRNSIVTSFQLLEDAARRTAATDDQETEHDLDLLPDYIHLENVLIYTGSAEPLHVPAWRGRIDSISGFSFGALGPLR
jgi:hypothetical protein